MVQVEESWQPIRFSYEHQRYLQTASTVGIPSSSALVLASYPACCLLVEVRDLVQGLAAQEKRCLEQRMAAGADLVLRVAEQLWVDLGTEAEGQVGQVLQGASVDLEVAVD